MPKLTQQEKDSMVEFHEAFPSCWMCRFLAKPKPGKTELHHIAGRGRYHNVRQNYAALCQVHHETIQSRIDAELICLGLKFLYDRAHYCPKTICDLRQRAHTCWTQPDINQTIRVMEMVRECF